MGSVKDRMNMFMTFGVLAPFGHVFGSIDDILARAGVFLPPTGVIRGSRGVTKGSIRVMLENGV